MQYGLSIFGTGAAERAGSLFQIAPGHIQTERLDRALAAVDDCLESVSAYPACQVEILELLTAFDKAASQLDPAVLFPVNAWAEPVLTQPSDSEFQE